MKLNLVPARTGLQWVRIGVRTYLRQPMALTSLFMLLFAATALLGLVPLLGLIVVPATPPAAALVMMAAARAAIMAAPGSRAALAVPALREAWGSRFALLRLGVVHALLLALAVLAVVSLAGDVTMPQGTGAEAQAQAIAALPLLAVLGLVNVGLLLWFAMAAALAHWHRVTTAKSLFFAAVALLRNLPALLVFALAWLAVAIPVGLAIGVLASILGVGGVSGSGPVVAAFNGLVLGAGLVLATLMATSVFFVFHDCFHQPLPEESPPP